MGIFDKLNALFQSDKLDISERFELLRAGVSGTMSKFYMARERKSDEIVGLKIADMEKTKTFENRFKGFKKPAEGEIATSIKHPRVVETYEYGVTNSGENYILMQYIHGSGMNMLIHNRDSGLEGKRLRLIRQMAEGLAAVHEEGFIHRDICPRNFICDPDLNFVKLIDFGLTVPNTKDFTQPGNRTGTPLYMAAEVVRRRPTSSQLDIFSLGVTAYHLCTFELPWPVGDASGLVALSHDTQAPTDIFHYAPQLNKTLAQAIMSCLAPRPEDRPASADYFLRLLRNLDEVDERA